MAIQFPPAQIPWSVKPRLVDFGGVLTPPLGGPEQRLGRLGARYAADVSFPSMNGIYAKAMIAARVKARTLGSTLIMSWPQPAVIGNYGAPVVSGGGQAGAVLNVSAVSKGVIEAGTFFSFVVGGRNYLHMVTDTLVIGSSGLAALQIGPMMRAQPLDQTPINFQNPSIEGFIAGNVEDWSVDMLTKTSVHAFTLQECQ